jgi:hypothetical protein
MLVLALAFNAFVVALACIGMMVVFMGGGGYLPVLILLLVLSVPVSALMLAGGFAWFVRRYGVRRAPAAVWGAIPQWLAVTFWLGAALIFCGELALLVTLQLADEAPRFWQHLPLLAGTVAALAYSVMYAVRAVRATQ